jgi:hypothetical protein
MQIWVSVTLTVTNPLAFYKAVLITAVKHFTVLSTYSHIFLKYALTKSLNIERYQFSKIFFLRILEQIFKIILLKDVL